MIGVNAWKILPKMLILGLFEGYINHAVILKKKIIN